MAECIKCKSDRIIDLQAHCSDLFCLNYKDREIISSDYVPYEMGIGGGDDVLLEICMECGQVQGEFPIDHELFKEGEDHE
jgi:hypothetical protein